MRYFRHLSLWTVCGLLVVGLCAGIAGAMVGGISAWASVPHYSASSARHDAFSGACVGGVLGAYSGAVCGFVALLCLAIPRPPVGVQSAARVGRALATVGALVLVGTPVLVIGFEVVMMVALRIISHTRWHAAFHTATNGVFLGHFVFVALPALIGAIAASRAFKKFETPVFAVPERQAPRA